MELGLVQKIDIDHEVKSSYLDYAMSVIISRALPDARDGLKPVQRRILYAMFDMGIRQDSPYRKSARIVGEVLGKYHPHGDQSVYESMARMAQDFSMRTPLIDGQGNFGSIDGDPPAAMRYTEARLGDPSLYLLADIGKNTVDFSENFDGTLHEPIVLPSALPNLLVNGATGIAVGMATNIPPHNLSEIVDASIFMLSKWEKLDDVTVEDLMVFVKGPDFPTGGIIIEPAGEEGLEAAYGKGRGRVSIQSKFHVEEMERGKNRIIVTELPFQVNKSALIERIAELVRDGALVGITDLRDESDRHGMRIVIELTKNVNPEEVIADLFKRTPMQSTFSINLLALVNNEPRLLTLKQALKIYLEHRLVVIKRRSEFDLEKARARAHILEGLLIALKYLDEIITLIRNSPDSDSARIRLKKQYKLTDIQANAILDMQLRRLAALERRKIETEFKEMLSTIKELEALLKSPKKMRGVAADDLSTVKEAFGDRRRTEIVNLTRHPSRVANMNSTDLISDQPIWIGVTASGLVARSSGDKPPRLSGIEAPVFLVKGNTSDTFYLISSDGMAASIPAHTLPVTEKFSEGIPFYKTTPLPSESHIAAAISLPGKKSILPENIYIVTITHGGMVKKSGISDLPGPSAQPYRIAVINDGDQLGWVCITDGSKEFVLVTAKGMGIRFNEAEVRPMGLIAAGVNGIKLAEDDEVIGCQILPGQGDLLLVTTVGKGKRIDINEFPSQGRYGKGVIMWELSGMEKLVGLGMGKPNAIVTLHLAQAASKSSRFDRASIRKRASVRGDSLVDVKPSDRVQIITEAWFLEKYLAVQKMKN
jgi:DNA gyrase subunit A